MIEEELGLETKEVKGDRILVKINKDTINNPVLKEW